MSNICIISEDNYLKCSEIMTECAIADQEIKNTKKELEKKEKHKSYLESKIRALLPKGYWFTYEIDTSWKFPKKYSIKGVSCGGERVYITVKEVFKKKPWPTFTGESVYRLEEFVKLNIYKTEEEAKYGYAHRVCPKCGGFMWYGSDTWCDKCMHQRRLTADEFAKSHRFYDPITRHQYHVGYEDELTKPSWRGYEGQSFTIRRLDTGEIIHTNNLWSDGFGDNISNLPEIEFISKNECGE